MVARGQKTFSRILEPSRQGVSLRLVRWIVPTPKGGFRKPRQNITCKVSICRSNSQEISEMFKTLHLTLSFESKL
jgi:hypothetical protein